MLPPTLDHFTLLKLLQKHHNAPLRLFEDLSKSYEEIVALQIGSRTFVAGLGPKIHNYVLQQNPDQFMRYHRPYARRLYPEDLERLDGDRHLKKRVEFTPVYAKANLEELQSDFNKRIKRTIGAWEQGQRIEIVEEIQKLVEAIFLASVVGMDVQHDPAAVHRIIRRIRHHLSTPMGLLLDFVPQWVPFSTFSRLQKDLAEFEALLLAGMKPNTGARFSRLADVATLRNHGVVTLPGAIGVTTAALVWIAYLIAQHPDVNQKVTAEIRSLIGVSEFTYSKLHHFKYLHAVVKEGLRLYSNVGIISRVSTRSFDFEGYQLPKNSYIGLVPYVLHRNERLFSQPNKFMPERFLSIDHTEISSLSYLPFGLGQHNCIGRDLALQTIMLVLVSIWQNYRLELCLGQSLFERQLSTQEIDFRLYFRLNPQDGAVEPSSRMIFGDAIGAFPGPC